MAVPVLRKKTLAALPVIVAVFMVMISGFFAAFSASLNGRMLLPLVLWFITAILLGVYFALTLIYIPINTGVILIDHFSGRQVAIGGPQEYGYRWKFGFWGLWAHPESDKDFISIQRRQIKDQKESFTSSDKIRFSVTYAGNYAPDNDRLVFWRSIDPVGVDEAVEGAFTSLIRAEVAKFSSQQLQETNDLQEAINKFRGINSYALDVEESPAIQQLLLRWPVADVQLNIEELLVGEDTRQVQEGVKQAKDIAGIATDIALPKLPDENSIQYKLLLMEAREKHKQATSVELPAGDEEKVAVLSLLWARLSGLTYEKAFQQAMVIANKTRGVNVTGTNGAGVFISAGNKNHD